MTLPAFEIRPETAADSDAVETLITQVFGPGATTRAAWALREGVPHLMPLARTAIVDSTIAGSVRFTPVLWGGEEVLMLGPLGVARSHCKQGIGRALMKAGMEAVNEAQAQGGHDVVILVGDLDYYRPFGFTRISSDRISLPRPADPARVLGCEIVPGAMDTCQGDVVQCLQR